MKLTDEEHYYLNRASEKCASYWFIALPIERHNCNLITAEFRDGIALRYGEAPRHLTVNCPCGKPFSIFHDLRCAKGGYTHRRDTIRDTFATTIGDVCYHGKTEPHVQRYKASPLISKQRLMKFKPDRVLKRTVYGKQDSAVRFSM